MKNKIKSFEDLEILRLSHSFVLEVCKIIKSFPKTENYILTEQIIRTAHSIPANIAGCMKRFSTKELTRFLVFARSSVQEIKYHLILANNLGYIDTNTFENFNNNYTLLGKKINSLISSIKF
ncbi:MAG: four helix bundle protein [Bacteroidota bacterium]